VPFGSSIGVCVSLPTLPALLGEMADEITDKISLWIRISPGKILRCKVQCSLIMDAFPFVQFQAMPKIQGTMILDHSIQSLPDHEMATYSDTRSLSNSMIAEFYIFVPLGINH